MASWRDGLRRRRLMLRLRGRRTWTTAGQSDLTLAMMKCDLMKCSRCIGMLSEIQFALDSCLIAGLLGKWLGVGAGARGRSSTSMLTAQSSLLTTWSTYFLNKHLLFQLALAAQ